MDATASEGGPVSTGDVAAPVQRDGDRAGDAAIQPRIIVQAAGEAPRIHELDTDTVRLGRADDNEIRLPAPFVSRYQAILSRTAGGYLLTPGPGATTPLIYHGRPLTEPVELRPGDFFRIEGGNPGEMVTCVYLGGERPSGPATGTIAPVEGRVVRVGSAPENDIGADNPLLASYHAIIERRDGLLRLTDLSGAGDTLVNGAAVAGATALATGDAVRIGTLRLTVDGDTIQYRDQGAGILLGARRPRAIPDDLLSRMTGTGGVLVEARHLKKEVRGGVNLLQDISLRVRPREMVVLVGLSGAGKSTLLDALAGYRPATSGEVLVDGVNLYEHLDRFRTSIGFVPQRDIIHMGLTVYEALDYAGRLRMPPGTTAAARHERIEEVLADLGLGERRDVRVSALSGGQQKRVSIGVELLTRPSLFFLDEPTSGLDPGTETGLMQLLRNLADQGRTVVLITHATKNVMLADKVIFLIRGGRLAWFGPPAEALAYFDRYRPERERQDKVMEFDRIYALLEDPAAGTPEEWDARFKADPAYQRYIAAPLRLTAPNGAVTVAAAPPPPAPRTSALRQLAILSSRNLKLLTRDRFALLLMLAAAPLLALLDFLITKRQMYDPTLGDVARIITNINTMIVNAMLIGALAQMREIIRDRDIYKRERLVSLRIVPYVLSKFWLAALLSLYQALAWVGIRYLAVDMPGGWGDAAGIYATIVLATLAGMMLGLFASAIAPTEDSVALLVALLIVPQVLFSGAHLPAHQLNPLVRAQMDIMPSRWAFEALMTQTEVGKALTADSCRRLPPAEREALSEADKQTCACLGANIFTDCDFPGIRAFYNPAVDQPEPPRPALPAGVRAEPATATSLTAEELRRFQADLDRYQTDYTTWKEQRGKAISGAEGWLDANERNYRPIYDVNVAGRWLALGAIIVALLGLILAVQRVKERR